MKVNNPHPYLMPSIISIGLHIVLLTVMFFGFTSTYTPMSAPSAASTSATASESEKAPEIVRATRIDAAKIQTEINRLQREEQQQRAAEQARQQSLKQQAEKARKQREAEQKRLADIKKQAVAVQRAAEQKRIAEEKMMQKRKAELNAAQAKEREKLREQQIAEEKRLAEIKAQQAEQVRIAGVARQQNEVERYRALIASSIDRNLVLLKEVEDSVAVRIQIRLAPTGSILSADIVSSSGDAIFDRAALNAVYKSSPLPVSNDEAVFAKLRTINLTVKPDNLATID